MKTIIYEKVLKERQRQDEKFGKTNRHPLEWLSILQEEIGEISKEINDVDFYEDALDEKYEKEIIQTISVGFAMLEDYLETKQKYG